MRLEAEERQHPPAVEVPLPKTPGDDGYFSWRLDDAIFKQRKRRARQLRARPLGGAAAAPQQPRPPVLGRMHCVQGRLSGGTACAAQGVERGSISPGASLTLAPCLYLRRVRVYRWADARDFHETDRCRHAAFQADWSRCCQDRLVHLVVEADDGDDAHDDELSINTSEMDEVRQVLKQHCAQLYQAFDWYCAEGVAAAPATPLSGARDDFFQIDLPSFVQLCREARPHRHLPYHTSTLGERSTSAAAA